MTIPYNASARSMTSYIKDSLVELECKKDNCVWYSDSEKSNKPYINHLDIKLLVSIIRGIILNDFVRIKKLIKYLDNICGLLNKLNLPIK